MRSPDIIRCADCTHKCDKLFVDAAIELTFTDDGTTSGIERAERAERAFKFTLREIVGCELTSTQITENLEGLMEGRAGIHG